MMPRRLEALARIAEQVFEPIRAAALFKERGFAQRTIEALVARGIDSPERLLFMAEDQIKKIHGVGKASMREITTYRARYLKCD